MMLEDMTHEQFGHMMRFNCFLHTGIKWACLLNLSTMVQIPLLLCCDFGKPTMKSMPILSHGVFGIGSGGCDNP